MTTPTVSVVELIGNPRAGSRTRALADAVVAELSGRPRMADTPLGRPRVLELAELVGVTFGPRPARAVAPLDDPFAPVSAAGLLVVATPTYKGTYTGLLKIFLDQFRQGDLSGVVALPVTVAASADHLASVTAALRDLLAELGADVPSRPPAVLESRLAAPAEVAAEWAAWHAGEVADLLSRVSAAR
ncbi:NAD(P)H-dependent oxidoreductase [Planosporangium mesophilum]|uniref:FMN reductase n=1 Tax=Planosporangium mesophilum TaxID=689768 RepID=A0A8J3TD74_9ACTN|nr:NAD(P)H-dependent oxidoreductase [Planosporangium mesophilum]NJC84498.1 NAD(P)H-dependent oxidoreductase [Planosporangium mesophilum]GII23356.1 FMN reductase [Planosporangium mesophilum]